MIDPGAAGPVMRTMRTTNGPAGAVLAMRMTMRTMIGLAGAARDDDEDEDEDDRPRRRVRKRRRPEEEMGWLDQTFANTSMVLLVLFPLCCSVIALVFGIVGVAGCQTSEGKKRALIVLLIAVCTVVFQVIIGILKFHAAVR